MPASRGPQNPHQQLEGLLQHVAGTHVNLGHYDEDGDAESESQTLERLIVSFKLIISLSFIQGGAGGGGPELG